MRLVPARALAAAAWVLVGAIFACRHFQPQPPPPINDGKPRLALHVAGPRGYERLSDHHLPLSSAAKFKLEVNLPKGYHASLSLLSSTGRLQKLASRPAESDQPVALPPAPGRKLVTLDKNAGTEFFFVCTSTRGAVELSDVEPLLSLTA